MTVGRYSRVFLIGLLASLPAAAQLDEARRAEAAGDLRAAERAYETEVKSRPAAETWQRLGLVRHLQNKYEAAIPAFREAVRREASLWTSNLFLGICLYRMNQFQEALTALEQAARSAPAEHPGRDELDFWLGATEIALKRPLSGLQHLERLLARNQKHAPALELAVQTYSDLGSALWNQVAEEDFESAPGQEVHGHALESEGNREGALEAFRVSKALGPSRAGPGLAIGRLLMSDGKSEEALAILEEELSLVPNDPETSFSTGIAAIQVKRFDRAAELLELATRWAHRFPEAPMALAQVYLAVKQPAKAVQAARQAVEVAPTLAAAHELLMAGLSQAGQDDEMEAERRRWQAIQQRGR